MHIVPLQDSLHFQVWLQSTVALWRRAPHAPILYLGNFFPRFSSFFTICFFLILYISFSSCYAQAAGSKLLAQLPFVGLVGWWLFFLGRWGGGVFYLLWEIVSTTISLLSILTFLPNTHFQSSRGFHKIQASSILKVRGQKTSEQKEEISHIKESIRIFKSLNNYPESFLDNLFDVWLNDSMQSYCWSATIINQTDTTT